MQAIDKQTDKLLPLVCFGHLATGNKVPKVCQRSANGAIIMYHVLSEMGVVRVAKTASYVKKALEYIFHRYKRELHEKENVPVISRSEATSVVLLPCGLTGSEDL